MPNWIILNNAKLFNPRTSDSEHSGDHDGILKSSSKTITRYTCYPRFQSCLGGHQQPLRTPSVTQRKISTSTVEESIKCMPDSSVEPMSRKRVGNRGF